MSKQAYFFCELVRTASTASAQAAFEYAARLGVHRTHPDPLIHLSSGAMPDWVQDGVGGGDYWAAADEFARVGARRVFVIVAALPSVLDAQQQVLCAKEFADAVSCLSDDLYGRMPYTLAIHAGGDRNPHLHVLLSQCLNTGASLARERWFRRYRADQPESGGARKVVVVTQKRWRESLRETWEQVGNRVLARFGTGYYLDRQSYAAKGIDRIPGLRLGPLLSPEHPHPARCRREQRNREVEEENQRREDEDARLQRELKRLSRQALRAMDSDMRRLWVQFTRASREAADPGRLVSVAESLLEVWRTGAGSGVGVVEPSAMPNDTQQWQRLYELVHEPAYRYAAVRWLDHEWVAGVTGPYVVWLHPEAEPLIDCGGAIWTEGRGLIEAAALALLLHSRGVQAAECNAPQPWKYVVEKALDRAGIKVAMAPRAQTTGSIRNAPKPSPFGARR